MPWEGLACLRKAFVLVLVWVEREGLGFLGVRVGMGLVVGGGMVGVEGVLVVMVVVVVLVVAGPLGVGVGVGFRFVLMVVTGGCLFGAFLFMIAGTVGGLMGAGDWVVESIVADVVAFADTGVGPPTFSVGIIGAAGATVLAAFDPT